MNHLALASCLGIALAVAPVFSRSVSASEPAALARIVAAEGTNPVTVTLKVDIGALFNGSDVDVLTPTGKVTARMSFPPNIDMLMKGDEVKGVRLQLQRPIAVANGLLAEAGKYADYAAAQKVLPKGSPPATPVTTVAPSGATSANACPYTAAELTTALGIKMEEGRGRETPFAGGTGLSCTYGEIRGFRSVVVNQIVMPTTPSMRAEFEKRFAGKMEPVAGDPDLAKWQVDQGDLTGVTLHYLRKDRQVEFRVMGVPMKDLSAVQQMRAKVLKLRRLP